ncbi:SH3 domain-containing protein [Azospirillum sp. B506]|uniref:SH3 domain-containing protein n=1 Tax=Azospirillum sp. B506 TaxID=137721 RepID=UPI000344EDAC|nr:SH3 domain-containing protein [Azospirillum sp. B506]
MAGARLLTCLRIAAPALLLGGLLSCPADALAEAAADRPIPSPAPIVALPRLTPTQVLSPPLTPGVVWEHPPDVPAPLGPPGPQPGPAQAADPTAGSPAAMSVLPPAPTSGTAEAPPTVKAPPLPAMKPQNDAPPRPSPAEPVAKPPATAPAQRTMTATAGIYLRATPDAKGRVLDTVEKGEPVIAFGAPANGWQRVGRNGKPQGYVTSAFLAEAVPSRVPRSEPAALPTPGRYAKAGREDRGCALPDDLPGRAQRPRLSGGTVARLRAAGNLRIAPVCDAKVLDVLEAGERVTVLEAVGDWYRIGRKGKTLGYVGAALLAPLKR